MFRSKIDSTLPEAERMEPSLLDALRQRAGTIATIIIFLLALLALQALLRDFHYHQVIAQLRRSLPAGSRSPSPARRSATSRSRAMIFRRFAMSAESCPIG